MKQWYREIASTRKIHKLCFHLQGKERWWDGESNICCGVLLDMVRAKTHKVGYYLCKSRRVPEPRENNQHYNKLRVGLGHAIQQDHLDAEAQATNTCSMLLGAATSINSINGQSTCNINCSHLVYELTNNNKKGSTTIYNVKIFGCPNMFINYDYEKIKTWSSKSSSLKKMYPLHLPYLLRTWLR